MVAPPDGEQPLVTIAELAALTGRTVKNLSCLLHRKNVRPVRRRFGHTGLYDRSIVLKAAAEAQDPFHKRAPEGHVSVREAAERLNVPQNTLQHRYLVGSLKTTVVVYGMVRRHFVSLETLAELEREFSQPPAEAPAEAREAKALYFPPLIHPDDGVCLEARRRLWEEKGRVFGRVA
jgi:hypothetical protein